LLPRGSAARSLHGWISKDGLTRKQSLVKQLSRGAAPGMLLLISDSHDPPALTYQALFSTPTEASIVSDNVQKAARWREYYEQLLSRPQHIHLSIWHRLLLPLHRTQQ